MPRYVGKPDRAVYDSHSDWPEGETRGDEVHDDGSWSEDQPTGILDANGDMLYRLANRIGFLTDLEVTAAADSRRGMRPNKLAGCNALPIWC